MNSTISTKPLKIKIATVRAVAIQVMFALSMMPGTTVKAQNIQNKPGVFYSITGNGLRDTSYLFGTYHLIKSSYLNETPNVLKAFDKASGVITEIVIDSTELASVNEKALLKEKQLPDLFNKKFADSLDGILKTDLGAGLSQVNTLKPMTVMLMMSMVYLIKENQQLLNKYSGSALDGHFVEKGKAAGKIITPLETITEQADLLFNAKTDEQQANDLIQFIRNKQVNIRIGNDLLKSYFDNDLDAIQNLYEESLKISGEKDYLVKPRNAKWMKVLPALLIERSQFIAVGALHLSGPDGLVEQLKKQGYTITALKL